MAKILVVTLSEGLTDFDVHKLVSKIEKMRGVESVEIEEDEPFTEENEMLTEGDTPNEAGTTVKPYVFNGEVVTVTYEDNRERVIYEWVDPDRNVPVYVGQTLDYTSRIAAQLRDAKKLSLGKWLYSQRLLGKKPIVRQVTKVKGQKAADREECNRISELTAQGNALINRTQGNLSVNDEVDVQFLK